MTAAWICGHTRLTRTSRHLFLRRKCPLSGVKRTLPLFFGMQSQRRSSCVVEIRGITRLSSIWPAPRVTARSKTMSLALPRSLVAFLEPIAVRGLFSAITADRHAAPFSRPPPGMVGEHQRAAMSLACFHPGEIFLTHELRQCFADRQQ